MKIVEALNWGQEQLKQTSHEKHDIDPNPMVDAQILLAACLKKPTAFLFSHFEDVLPEAVIDQYQRYIERRKRHEPVAYILQKKAFYGRDFHVNPSVLTPRPETEQMIELAKERAQDDSTLIDIGTGSGAIAVTLAAELDQPVVAIDIDPQTLAVAQHNASQHNVDHLISFLHGSLLEPIVEKNINESGRAHAMILANLPYLKINQWMAADPDIRYEPKHALVAGVDGLDEYDALLQQLQKERGRFPASLDVFFEIDPSQELTLPALVREYFPNAQIEGLYDLAGHARIVMIAI